MTTPQKRLRDDLGKSMLTLMAERAEAADAIDELANALTKARDEILRLDRLAHSPDSPLRSMDTTDKILMTCANQLNKYKAGAHG
jgi:hypothetical protein